MRLLVGGFFLIMTAMIGCTHYPPLDQKAQLSSDYTYIIGPGDTLEMFVWGNPEVSREVPVRPDGKITAPLVEELQASGKTPYQLARDIEKQLSKYIRNPLVTVIVNNFVGPYAEQIRVIGAFGGGGFGVASGGAGGAGGGSIYRAVSFPYTEHMTVLDLAIQIGDLGGDYAAGNRASIVRVINGEQIQFGVRLEDLIRDGDITANVELLPGDILFIPEAFF